MNKRIYFILRRPGLSEGQQLAIFRQAAANVKFAPNFRRMKDFYRSILYFKKFRQENVFSTCNNYLGNRGIAPPLPPPRHDDEATDFFIYLCLAPRKKTERN